MRLNVSTGRTLVEEITLAHAEIDAAAGRARSRYITTVPGQPETYLAKAADAQAYKDAGYPASTDNFPWIKAESDATGVTPRVAADTILTNRDLWTAIGVSIEKERMTGKTAASAEASISGVIRAKREAVSALDAL